MAEINLGTLYDFNKEAMKNEKPLDAILLNKLIIDIANDMKMWNDDAGDQYWMLLCHERRDYTIFNIYEASEIKFIVDELSPTLQNRGAVLAIDKQPDSAWEIWIRDIESNENFAYYLFQYDNGVIEINN